MALIAKAQKGLTESFNPVFDSEGSASEPGGLCFGSSSY